MARSGFIPRYKAVLGAGAKAKTMTNLLILLSVLGFRAVIFFFFLDLSPFLMGYSISSSTRSISHYESKIVIWFNRELISVRNIWFKLLFVLPFFAHVKVIQLFFQIYLKTVKRSEILSLTDNNLDAVKFLCSVQSPGKLAGRRLGREGKTCKWCSWAGFVYFKKQNRELSFARSVGQAGLVKQNLVDGEVLVDGRKLSVMINLINDSSVGRPEHET